MLNAIQLRDLIIKPALLDLLMYSEDAVQLLLFTCANESEGGFYLHQVKGPALGIFQMEPATYNDLWVNYILKDNSLFLILLHSFDAPRMPSEDRLIYDLRFATAMSRIYYRRVTEALPNATDINGIWDYYKKYYNTSAGAAIKQAALTKYHTFIST